MWLVVRILIISLFEPLEHAGFEERVVFFLNTFHNAYDFPLDPYSLF
jgi:hypothetical protein